MSTLLDRLLEVAKDFEAERLQDQLTAQRRERSLEQDLKALKRTALYRADEISFLENQLSDMKTELETANEALKEAQDLNVKRANTAEINMKREIVCLRLEIARLRNINNKMSNKLKGAEDDEKENSSVTKVVENRASIEKEMNEEEEPVLISREGIDIQGTAADLFSAAERGDLSKMEEILSPSCVCIDSYEQLLTKALSSVCSASTISVLGGEGVENDDNDEDVDDHLPSSVLGGRLKVAKLLILEGAQTNTALGTASGSGTNAVKKNKFVPPAPLHMAAWSGNSELVELLLSQPNPPLNVTCEGTKMKGTPLQLAVNSNNGSSGVVAKALLMAGADPDEVLSADATNRLSDSMKNIFDDCTVMFWNSSVRAFEAYSSSNYDKALAIWGDALTFIKNGNLPISDADKARLHYNRVR